MIDSKKARTRYNSEYERSILCQYCDNIIIGKLDDYFAQFLHGEFPKKTKSRLEYINGVEHMVLDENPYYDYKRYKLFLLSLLWRSSISSRPFFSRIKLSELDEEALRRMIIDKDPGPQDKYPCFIFMPPLIYGPNGERGFSLFYMPTMSPLTAKDEKWEICKFIIQGMTFHFMIAMPPGTKVEPSVLPDKLVFKVATEEEQADLIREIMEVMRDHER